MATVTPPSKPQSKEFLDSQERDRRRNQLRAQGKLFRVQNPHPAVGAVEVEAKSEEEAVAAVARDRFPSQAKNKEWLEAFGLECRVVRLPPAVEPK